MMRAWKAKKSVLMGGLLIDTLAYQFIDELGIQGTNPYLYYDYMCRDFLSLSWRTKTENKEYWRAPGSNAVCL